MKQLLIFGLLCVIFGTISCMELTEQEHACMVFFVNSGLRKKAIQALSSDDKNILCNGTLYSEKPKELTNVFENMTTSFYNLAEKKGITIPWDKNFFSTALIKTRIAIQNKAIVKHEN